MKKIIVVAIIILALIVLFGITWFLSATSERVVSPLNPDPNAPTHVISQEYYYSSSWERR